MGQLLAAGHINWDVTLRVSALPEPDGEARITEQHRAGGGSAANVASALAGLELDAGLIGSVGTDEQGQMAVRELEATGVDVSRVITVEGETTVKYLVVDDAGEVMVLANDGVNEAVGPEDVAAEMVAGASHLHLTGQRPATAARLIDLAQTAGLTVSFDPGRRVDERDFSALLEAVDVLLVNELEARAVFGDDEGAAIAGAAGPERTIVVKRGADGASLYAGGEPVHHPGFAVEAVDTTGAGDAFAAGYLAATVGGLAPGDGDGERPDPEQVLAIANASGALTVQQAGARSAPDRAALKTFLAERTA
jgi:ribokinase